MKFIWAHDPDKDGDYLINIDHIRRMEKSIVRKGYFDAFDAGGLWLGCVAEWRIGSICVVYEDDK